jgi:stage II sporulation protein D
MLGLMTVGAMAGALPLGRAAAAPATAGPPRLPDHIRVRDAGGGSLVVPVDEYLKGVVPAEMPPSWPIEALKAQAVAARTYVAAYIAQRGDVCSSSACQVYNPAKRSARADAAVDATRGELLTYQGGMIWSYYSSTCGGQTADGGLPYCQSVRCSGDRAPLDLRSEAAASAFWASDGRPAAFCSASGSFRWGWSLSPDQLQALLDRTLGISPGVAPRYAAGALGSPTELTVAERGLSGKAARLRIAGSGGAWTVTGETNIRSVARSALSAGVQRSANLFLHVTDGGLTARGGGAGHGTGMCQFGARGMALAGRDYRSILTHYYSGVELVRV